MVRWDPCGGDPSDAAFSSAATFVEVPDYDFLSEQGVRAVVPWIMPTGDNFGSARVSIDRALATGLTLTPLAESVRDIHEWWHSDAVTEKRRRSLLESERSLIVREPAILEAWRRRSAPQ